MKKEMKMNVILWGILFLLVLPSVGESGLGEKVEELADRLAFSSEGEVLGIEGKTAYLSLGQKDGVLEGNRFEVVRLGDPLMAGDKIVGYKETIVGELKNVTTTELSESRRKDSKVTANSPKSL